MRKTIKLKEYDHEKAKVVSAIKGVSIGEYVGDLIEKDNSINYKVIKEANRSVD